MAQQSIEEMKRLKPGRTLADLMRERLDSFYMPTPEEWQKQMERHDFKLPENGRAKISITAGGKIAKITITDMGVETTPILGKQATQVIQNDPHIPSVPQVSETDRMWSLVVLAARSSRYEE